MSAATVAAARQAYLRAVRDVWDRCYELTVTALEDTPAQLDLASETLCEAATEVEGAAHALLAVVGDLPEVLGWPCREFVDADVALSEWRLAFERLQAARDRVDVDRRSNRDPVHDSWLGVIDTSIALGAGSGRRCERARLALWRELVETDTSTPLHRAPLIVPVTSAPGVQSASSSEEAPA